MQPRTLLAQETNTNTNTCLAHLFTLDSLGLLLRQPLSLVLFCESLLSL